MRAYIAGPMRNVERFNFPAFYAADAELTSRGWTIHNPARHDEEHGFDPGRSVEEQGFEVTEALKHDLAVIISWADAVFVLPGWEASAGAQLEVAVAQACGVPVLDLDEHLVTTSSVARAQVHEPSILHEAHRLVHGDRGDAYGHPLDDLGRTALIWSAILGVPVSAEQVSLCMVGVKISRECNAPKRDNAVDIAGYAETLHMIHAERARRGA